MSAHDLTAAAVDAAGNTSVASAILAVTIDTTDPNAPGVADLDAGSDSGTLDDDNITNDTTPTLAGTSDVGAVITLTSSVDGAVGTATADGAGVWALTSSALTEGAHDLTATATDAAGNTSAASAALTVTIDSLLPNAPTALDLEAASDSGTNDDDITNITTPTISGTAENGSTVELFEGFLPNATRRYLDHVAAIACQSARG